MKTKIFISWSGNKSKDIALLLKKWIPILLSNIDTFVSDADVEKGTRGMERISMELQDTSYGIFCLTADNISSPWIYFEAGAISKIVDNSKIMPILFDLESSDIPAGNPLLQFQYTRFEKSDFLKCINSINSCCGESSIPEISVSILLDNLWSNIEREVREAILKNTIEVDHSKGSDIVTDREVLEEVLQEIRNQTTLITRVPKIRNPGYINPRAISDVGVSYENVIKHLEEYVIDQSVESLENISSGLVELERPIKYLLEVMKKNNGQIELQLNQSKQPTTSISAIDGQVTLLPEERPSLQGMHALAKALSGRKINPQE